MTIYSRLNEETPLQDGNHSRLNEDLLQDGSHSRLNEETLLQDGNHSRLNETTPYRTAVISS